MMQKIKKSGKLFWKYFVYYLLILLIPIIITTVGINYFLFAHSEDQASTYADSIISLLGASFDDIFNRIYAVNELIINDDSLKYIYRESETHYTLYEYHNRLQNIKTIVPFLENIIILDLSQSSDYIVSSSGTYLPNFFYDNIYYFTSDLTQTDKHSNTAYITNGIVEEEDFLAYALPGAHTNAQDIYIIPHDYFNSILIENKLMNSLVAITDENYNLIYSYQYDKHSIDSIDLKSLSENNRITIDNEEYIVCEQVSNATNLIYIIMVPVSNITSNVSSLMFIYGICLLIVTVVGFIFSFMLAKKMTLPIYQLSNMVQQKIKTTSTDPTKTTAKDEFSKIESAFSSMHDHVEKMKSIMNSSSDDIAYINLMKLLTGELTILEEINDNLAQTNIVLMNRYYTVAVFDFNETITQQSKMAGFTYKQNDLGDNKAHLFYLNSYDTNYIYLLIMSEHPISDIQTYLVSLKKTLFKQFACDIALGFSNGNFHFNEIRNAFYNAHFALDYKYIMGKNAVLNSNNLQTIAAQNNESFDYRDYYKLLLSGSKEDIIRYISNYHMKITFSSQYNVHEIKVNILGIFHFLYETFPILVASYQKNVSAVLQNYGTAEEFLNYICDLSIYICGNLKHNNDEDKFLRINTFINENFYKDSFSMQLVADEVHMSISTLSKYYKDIAGINISEAVNQLKINKAKELLIQTDLTVNEIVLQIGYYNTSSFIRKFKEHTSVTPGKFREKHKTTPSKKEQ